MVHWCWSAGTLFWQLSSDQNINVQYVCIISFSCAPKLARKQEIEHCSRSSKTINWSADSFQACHLDQLTHEPAIWSWDTGQWLSCFDSCQLTILWMSYIKDVDLPRHARDTPSFLFIASPTPPVESVDAYVRTLSQSRDIFQYVWGSVPRALRGCGSPAIITESHTYVSKTPIHPRNFGTHVTTRPPARPSSPQGNQREMSHFLASVGACDLILHIRVVVNWQLSKQGVCWQV